MSRNQLGTFYKLQNIHVAKEYREGESCNQQYFMIELMQQISSLKS